MFQSIRYDDGRGSKGQMVAQNLIEHCLAQWHVVPFAFDHEQRLTLTIVADDIRSPVHAV